MKKLYILFFVALSSLSFAQTTITQWNFDDASPAVAALPTTGTGTFTLIGGVTDNLTSGLMPAGNPSTGRAYSIKGFPAAGTASGTAGYQFAVSTVGFTDQINVTFDPRGSNTASKWMQYEYSTDGGTTWTVLSNNGGVLANAFTATPMVALTFPASCSNIAGFAFRIVSIFAPSGTDYAAVGATSTYNGPTGAWRIDNVTFSSGILSTNQNSISGLSVYPNPVKNGVFYINTNANAERTVTVFDVLGKQVLNTKTSESAINVSSLNAGVYMVQITEEGKTATKKLVIE